MKHSGIDPGALSRRYQDQIAASQRKPIKTLAKLVAEQAHENIHPRPLPNPEPERHETAALEQSAPGKTEGVPRIIVRFTGHRVRPLDLDNFAGGVKDLLDGLRHAGLIPGDEPWRIKLEVDQVKVRKFEEEFTAIEIEIP